MNPNKASWKKGNLTEIATLMHEPGESFVRSLGFTTPQRTLDLGSGYGATAVAPASMEAGAGGTDIAKDFAEAGNKSAKEDWSSHFIQEGTRYELHPNTATR